MFALQALISGVIYVLLAFVSGALVTAAFLVPEGKPSELRLRLLGLALRLLLLYIAFNCFSLVIEGAKLRGAMPDANILFRYVTLTQGGKVWLMREVGASALALTTIWMIQKKASLGAVRLLALTSLPLLASRSLAGHAVAVRDGTTLAISADTLHLLATGLWGGGLMALSWVLHTATKQMTVALSDAAEIVRRFSLLAMISVVVLFVTGLYQSWIQVENLTILLSTDYGRVLLVKLVVFLLMVSVGGLNWLSTKPRLLSAQVEKKANLSLARKALTRIGVESFLALLIFLVTGFLTALPPGVHAGHETALANPSQIGSDQTNKRQPAEGARVETILPQPGQIVVGDKVPLKFKLTKGKRGDHVHAYIDGELVGMFMSNGTLNGVAPGHHVLELRVVAEDHQTELDATDRIEFTVKQTQEEKQ